MVHKGLNPYSVESEHCLDLQGWSEVQASLAAQSARLCAPAHRGDARVSGNGGPPIEFVPFAIFMPPQTSVSGSSQNSQSSTVRPPSRSLRYTVWPDIR